MSTEPPSPPATSAAAAHPSPHSHRQASDRILLDQAQQYRGLLIVPLRLPGDEYSFAVIDPESWDAADSDGTCYGSIEACLQGGRRRVERYFERMPACVHQLFEQLEAHHRAAGHPGTNQPPASQRRSPSAPSTPGATGGTARDRAAHPH